MLKNKIRINSPLKRTVRPEVKPKIKKIIEFLFSFKIFQKLSEIKIKFKKICNVIEEIVSLNIRVMEKKRISMMKKYLFFF